MKKHALVLLFLVLPLLTGCTVNMSGKFDDYQETFSGTVDLDFNGHGIIKAKLSPSGTVCTGKGWLTFTPISNYFLVTGACRGQKGEASLQCTDGRTITGEWTAKSCVTCEGTAITNKKENITFFVTPSKNKHMNRLEKYKQETKDFPSLGEDKNIDNNFMELLF